MLLGIVLWCFVSSLSNWLWNRFITDNLLANYLLCIPITIRDFLFDLQNCCFQIYFDLVNNIHMFIQHMYDLFMMVIILLSCEGSIVINGWDLAIKDTASLFLTDPNPEPTDEETSMSLHSLLLNPLKVTSRVVNPLSQHQNHLKVTSHGEPSQPTSEPSQPTSEPSQSNQPSGSHLSHLVNLPNQHRNRLVAPILVQIQHP